MISIKPAAKNHGRTMTSWTEEKQTPLSTIRENYSIQNSAKRFSILTQVK
jgi:hypothetical protein